MMNRRSVNDFKNVPNQWIRWGFPILIFLATLTGFGQMPIFKRYYIADIPGLGWLAQFYVTHFLHYLFGALLLGLSGFIATRWIIDPQSRQKKSIMDNGRRVAMVGILLTGAMLALKNFSGYWYPPSMIIALDLVHLGLVMMWLCLSLVIFLFRYRWIQGS